MRNPMAFLLALMVSVLLSGCGAAITQEQIPSDSSNVFESDQPAETFPAPTLAPSPTPMSLAEAIIGYWVCKGETEGFLEDLEFAAGGELIYGPLGESEGRYEVASETTIILNQEGRQEVIRVRDPLSDSLTIQTSKDLLHCKHAVPVPNLAEAIVGLWESQPLDDSGVRYRVGFTPEGSAYGNLVGGEALYAVTGPNTLLVDSTYSIYKRLHVTSATSDALELEGFQFQRVNGIPDLANKLVGFWKVTDGPEVFEFTPTGKMIINDSTGVSVYDYAVAFDRIIRLAMPEGETDPLFVISLSDDTLEASQSSFERADLRFMRTEQP